MALLLTDKCTKELKIANNAIDVAIACLESLNTNPTELEEVQQALLRAKETKLWLNHLQTKIDK